MSLWLWVIAFWVITVIWPLRIRVAYNRLAGDRSRVRVDLALFCGLIRLSRSFPGWLVIGQGLERSTKAMLERPGDPYWAALHFFRTEWSRLLLPRKVVRYLLNHVRLTRLKIRAAVGTGDAALTGFLLGLLWSVLGSTVAWFSWSKQMANPPVLELYPLYDRKALDIDFECISFLRPIHIIFAVWLYLVYRKDEPGQASGGGRVDCQSIQSRA